MTAIVLIGGIGAVGVASGASGLTIDQPPVEYQALDSNQHHVEVVFEDPIDPSKYNFTVTDAAGNVVAGNDEINEGLRATHQRQVTFDLGDRNLNEGATLHIEGNGIDEALAITTSSAFVQEGFETEPEIEPGDRIALVHIWHVNNYYMITNESGTVITDGTLGEDSYVAIIDTTGWNHGESYTVQFGRHSTIRTVSTAELPEDGSGSLPPYVLSRTGTGLTDMEPGQPGTTVKFDYDLVRGAMVVGEMNNYGTGSTVIDRWRTTPPSIPSPAAPEDTVSMFDVSINTHVTDGTQPSVTIRVPVFSSTVDGSVDDLEVRYYDGEEWVTLESSIIDRSAFYGQEKVTIEATSPEPGPIAIVEVDE